MVIIKDFWFRFVMAAMRLLPDVKYTMQLRGSLIRPCFAACGKNLQLASDVRIAGIYNLVVGRDVFLSGGVWVLASCAITIEDEVMLGPYVVLVTGDHSREGRSWRFGAPNRAPITLKRGCWVGAHSVVSKGITVGEGACIGAGSVVTRDVPNDAVVGGVPTKVIKALGE